MAQLRKLLAGFTIPRILLLGAAANLVFFYAQTSVPTGYDLEVFGGSSPCPGADGCAGAYWFAIDPSGDVQVDNGRFGAGNLVVKGPFAVLVEGMKGSTPEEVSVISLRGLRTE